MGGSNGANDFLWLAGEGRRYVSHCRLLWGYSGEGYSTCERVIKTLDCWTEVTMHSD